MSDEGESLRRRLGGLVPPVIESVGSLYSVLSRLVVCKKLSGVDVFVVWGSESTVRIQSFEQAEDD